MPNYFTGPYRHRRERDRTDDSKRAKYINFLVSKILALERATAPASDAEAANNKDYDAFTALRIAGRLVEHLAGWAIDHQIGLALNGLEFVPGQPSGTRDHPDYLSGKATADLHRHEAQGSAYFELNSPTERNAQAERRMLANLLQLNPGGFPSALASRAAEALRALDFGEVQDLLRAEKLGLDRNAYTRHQLELQALMHVEYFEAKGDKKISAQTTVGQAYGRSYNTIISWEWRLRETLGDLEVSRMLSFARNAGINAKAAKADKSNSLFDDSDFERFEAWHGENALEEHGKQYRAAVAGTGS